MSDLQYKQASNFTFSEMLLVCKIIIEEGLLKSFGYLIAEGLKEGLLKSFGYPPKFTDVDTMEKCDKRK